MLNETTKKQVSLSCINQEHVYICGKHSRQICLSTFCLKQQCVSSCTHPNWRCLEEKSATTVKSYWLF